MPTRNISFVPEQDAFVQKVVEAGEYQNASEAVRDALRAVQQRRREDALRLKVLRIQIAAGTDELERGDFVEVDAQDLEAFLQSPLELPPTYVDADEPEGAAVKLLIKSRRSARPSRSRARWRRRGRACPRS